MLANQLGRRGVRALIIDRHAGPSLQTRALGVQARTLEIYAQLGIVERALELGKRGTGANIWAQRAEDGARPAGRSRAERDARIRSSSSSARTTTNGSWATGCATGACRCSGTPSWSASSRQPDHVTATLQAARRHDPQDHRRVGRRLRRRAQRGARAERHRVPGRALRARVLRRRHRGDGQHGAGRGQRLSVAARASICSSRCAARITGASSASCPPALRGRDDVALRGRDPLGARRSGRRTVLQGVHLVLHLPHPSPQRRALPRPPLLPARRRGAHPQPGRRAGHEHRPAGRLQPGMEARARRRGPGGRRRCSIRTRPSASRSRGAC